MLERIFTIAATDWIPVFEQHLEAFEPLWEHLIGSKEGIENDMWLTYTLMCLCEKWENRIHMKNSSAERQLPILLSNRLLPWVSDRSIHRIIVAKPQMHRKDLPTDVQMEQRKLQGKRHIVKGNRFYRNTRIISAEWPDDNMMEMEIPKLICVTDGRMDIQLGEYLLSCSSGHSIFIPPRIPQPADFYVKGNSANDFCEFLQIILYRGGIQCILCRTHGSQHGHVKGENYFLRNEQIRLQFEQMMMEALSGEENHQLVYENSLANLLLLLQREIHAGRYLLTGAPATKNVTAGSSDDFSTELNRVLMARLGEPLTLESVARQMHLSRSHFAFRIRQETGKTFIQYLTELRLEEARILLRESDWTSIAISKAVGFKSVSYFYELFRNKSGLTPGEFRKQH